MQKRTCVYLAAIAAGLISCDREKHERTSVEPTISPNLLPTLAPQPEPQAMKIRLTLSSPQDLKVKPGETVKEGQILSDRTQERERLAATKQQLSSSLKKLEIPRADPLSLPPKPATPQELPPVSYAAEEAAIKLKAKALRDAKGAIAKQQQKISQLQSLFPNVRDPAARYQLQLTIEHEQAKLNSLRAVEEEAAIQLEIAQARLETAKERRAYAEYQQQVEKTRQVLTIEQQRLEIQRQEIERQRQLQMMEYNKTQINAQIQEVDNAIAQLNQVKAPYSGVVKEINWISQDNNLLTVELVLALRDDEGSDSNVSRQLSPVYRTTRIRGER